MRFGLKAKESVAVTLLTLLVVTTTTAIHLSQLSRIVVQEVSQQADLIAKQVYAQSSRSLSRTAARSPRDVLGRDRDLRNLLDASVGYSPHLLYALIADRDSRTIVHSERAREGTTAPERPPLQQLLSLDPISRFLRLSRGGQIYEARLPMLLNGEPFGSIRIGVSTTLLKRELNGALTRSLSLAAVALVVAWLVAMGLANLMLRPIRALSQEVGRLRQGEFDIGGGLHREDELGELASQLQLLGQELQVDRLKILGEKTRLEQVVDQLEDGLVLLNHARRVLFLNAAAEQVLGRPLADVLGTSLEDLLEVSHPLRPLLERAFAQQVPARNVTLTLPVRGRPAEFLVSVFLAADGQKAMGAVVLLKDLESIRTVQSVVSHSAKLAALGRLTSGVAHEVKNPLNAMMIHLELLKEKMDVSPEEAQHSLVVIGNEVRRLDRVVQGFLKFMRPQELTLRPVDLNGLLRNIAALLEAEWQKESVGFAFQLAPELPPITGDEELLHQAFMNLVVNGCQAMRNGGTVTITTELERRNFARVTVADEGVGIPPEDLDKIFRLYYTTKPEGSGVGLSLVYRIMQMHDGVIDVVSEVGKGTRVLVGLPVG
ncbi:MAG: PAS domain-containing protein [Candidatus Rokubacteria bacterium]|nr:PAS domain-containing protein [Candidatus Rokubacteria bacterium]